MAIEEVSEYGGAPGLIQPPPHDTTGNGDRDSVRDAAVLVRSAGLEES